MKGFLPRPLPLPGRGRRNNVIADGLEHSEVGAIKSTPPHHQIQLGHIDRLRHFQGCLGVEEQNVIGHIKEGVQHTATPRRMDSVKFNDWEGVVNCLDLGVHRFHHIFIVSEDLLGVGWNRGGPSEHQCPVVSVSRYVVESIKVEDWRDAMRTSNEWCEHEEERVVRILGLQILFVLREMFVAHVELLVGQVPIRGLVEEHEDTFWIQVWVVVEVTALIR